MGRAFGWWMRIGAVILVLTGAIHTAAQLMGEPPPKDETHAKLLELLRTYHLDLMGVSLTTGEILSGFGHFFGLALLTVAALAWMAARGTDPGMARGTAVVAAVFAAGATAISALHWPPPPTGLLGAATVCFLGAVVAGRPGRAE
jgi:hypothetical protein